MHQLVPSPWVLSSNGLSCVPLEHTLGMDVVCNCSWSPRGQRQSVACDYSKSAAAAHDHLWRLASSQDHSWSLGGQQQGLITTPEVHVGDFLLPERIRREHYYNGGSCPSLCSTPNNGPWPLRQPRLPLHTSSAAFALDSSPFRLFLHSQFCHSPWVWSTKPKLEPAVLSHTSRKPQAREYRAVALTVQACLLSGCCRPIAVFSSKALEPLLCPSWSPHKWGDFSGCRNLSSFAAASQSSILIPFSLSFFFFFCPIQLHGYFLALSKVWGFFYRIVGFLWESFL